MRLVAGQGFAVELHREDTAGRGHCGRELSERCCWPGRRGGAAGRGAAAKSHREDAAGWGAGWQVPYSAEAPCTEGFPAEVQLLKPPASSITL